VAKEEPPLEILQIDESVARQQTERLAELRRTRDNRRVTQTLKHLEAAARGQKNTMPYILDCVRAYATLGEISDALRNVFGTYEEVAIT
jgi:methylmalonyl-CoA mutase N-terminal domain/subunit